MDSLALANQSPVVSLLIGSMNEARKPYQRHGDGAAVAQFHREGVVADLDLKCRGCLCVKRGRIHATDPEGVGGCLRQAAK